MALYRRHPRRRESDGGKVNDSFETKPWLCLTCGYAMDRAMPVTGKAREFRAGDISLCMNCAEVFVWEAGAWRVALDADMDKLPAGAVGEIIKAKLAIGITRAVHGDLTKKDGGNA